MPVQAGEAIKKMLRRMVNRPSPTKSSVHPGLHRKELTCGQIDANDALSSALSLTGACASWIVGYPFLRG